MSSLIPMVASAIFLILMLFCLGLGIDRRTPKFINYSVVFGLSSLGLMCLAVVLGVP